MNSNFLKRFIKNSSQLLSFIVLITLFTLNHVILISLRWVFRDSSIDTHIFTKQYNHLVKVFDKERIGSISRVNLMQISFKNMVAKKTRTYITMGGMTLGIGMIVFLVSIGYGLEKLVIDRVARLDELRQTDVVPGLSDDLLLTDASLSQFKSINGVVDAIPVITAVGKVNYSNSETNMAVYGVTTKYLSESAIKPSTGKVFDSNELSATVNYIEKGEEEVDDVLGIESIEIVSPRVLGEDNNTLPIVEIPSLVNEKELENIVTVEITGRENRELVLNRSALLILGINESDALSSKVKLTLFIVESGNTSGETKTQSTETEYSIIGVLPDEGTPLIYVPFVDLKSMGTTKYSQIKVIVDEPDNLASIRAAVESSGYGTISVVDTVSQIDKLFSTARIFLAVLGVVALAVASLGMFNTLTVSLLERTREVGLMKAIGMKSSEVKELFLTESMIMGFFGGVLGLLFGMLLGFLLSLVLSIFSIVNGSGFINITNVPFLFGALILLLSLLIGVGTGYVPAKRATKISALDALRYE